ncbi:hypothetical protein BGX30_008852 [Mortierella sp. GBA39]|nr:hypothetical protein BGX30_008852 [Mortierella sp. GBA39]
MGVTNVVDLGGVYPGQDIVDIIGDLLNIVLDWCNTPEKRDVLQQPQATSPPTSAGQSGKKGHPALTSSLFDYLKTLSQESQSQLRNNSRLPLSPSVSEESLASKASPPTSFQDNSNIPAGKKCHPTPTSTLFNHLKDAEFDYPYRQEGTSISDFDTERPAGWGSDYVNPKGHPSLTSTVFSQAPPPPSPALSRPYKKTSHNIFGPPPVEKSTPVSVAAAAPVAAEKCSLEPSALDAELERNDEQQQGLKVSIVGPSELTTEDLEKQVLELEKLKI